MTLTNDQKIVLGAAALNGWYMVTREYNAAWGGDRVALRELEAMGLMKFDAYERNPLTKAFSHKSNITDAGKTAWEQSAA